MGVDSKLAEAMWVRDGDDSFDAREVNGGKTVCRDC